MARTQVPATLPNYNQLYFPNQTGAQYYEEKFRQINAWANSRSQPTVYEGDAFANTTYSLPGGAPAMSGTNWGLGQRIQGRPLLSFRTSRPVSFWATATVRVSDQSGGGWGYMQAVMDYAVNGDYELGRAGVISTQQRSFYAWDNQLVYAQGLISEQMVYSSPQYGVMKANTNYDFDINAWCGTAGVGIVEANITMLCW